MATKKKTTITVEVYGGCVTDVTIDPPIDFELNLIDHDSLEDEEEEDSDAI